MAWWTLLFVVAYISWTAEAGCRGHWHHKSVYSFVTPDNQRAWQLKHLFQTAVHHEKLHNTTISVHSMKIPNEESFGVQVKLCTDTSATLADIRFRCELRALQESQYFISDLGNFAEDRFIYRPLPGWQQVIPLRRGEETSRGNRWAGLLVPMIHEAGVDSLVCQ